MEYINSNLANVHDLESLDSRIGYLESLKTKIKNIAETKANEGAYTQTENIDNDEENRMLVERLLKQIEEVSQSLMTSDSIDRIEGLSEQYGKLSVLEDLKKLYQDKVEMLHNIEFLKACEQIEDKINEIRLDEESECAKLSEEIQALQESQLPIAMVAISSLSELLDKKVQQVRSQVESKLLELLDDIKWLSPKVKDKSIPSSKLSAFSSEVSKLVRLQAINNKPKYPETWWALDILLNPVITRFNYHFNTPNKETNKLSKPEWAFSFIESFITENLAYLEMVIGDAFKPFDSIIAYEIITTLLKPVREKMFKTIKILDENITRFKDQPDELEKSGRLLSHLIFELASFDQRLRNLYKYNPYIEKLTVVPVRKWIGLTGDVLLHDGEDNPAPLNWLNFEFELANKRFKSEILESKNAFDIDFDYQLSIEVKGSQSYEMILKPTYSAYSLTKLFDNLTSHYRTLSIVKYQLKYVSNIQLTLIDKYFESLNQLFKKFNDSFNSKMALSFIPGGLNNDTSYSEANSITNGIQGLQLLTEIYCSGKFIKDNLEQWSEELIFIQLWNAYKSVSSRSHSNSSTIFDTSLDQYNQLISKVLVKYEEFFKKEIRYALKNYVNSSQWNIKTSNNDPEASNDLSLLVDNIPTYLNYLNKCLSDLDFCLISDKIVSLISIIFLEYIIKNNQFSRLGIKQLKIDFDFIVNQLQHILFLNSYSDEFSNDLNRDYLELSQSIELLTSIDPNIAQLYKMNFNNIGELRSNFENRLSSLSNHEINDLLLRIL